MNICHVAVTGRQTVLPLDAIQLSSGVVSQVRIALNQAPSVCLPVH
ncbi:MAG: hypothetical protein ACJAYC_001502 [Halieaceae bacterium]|jgi:hypothetical protein